MNIEILKRIMSEMETQKSKDKEKKNAGICWDEKRKTTQQLKQTKLLQDVNQKVLATKGRLKRY